MIASLRSFLMPPHFPDDEEKTRVGRMLYAILLAVMALVILFSVPAYVLAPDVGRILIEIVLVVATFSMLALLRRGQVQLVGYLFGLTLWTTVAYGSYDVGGFAGSTMSAFIGIVVIVALILGTWAATIFGFLSILITGFMLYADAQGTLPPPPDYVTPVVLWIEFSAVVVGVIVLLAFVLSSLQQALSRARYNERALALKIEEAELLAQKATVANEFKSQLLARISHELRTPLGALMGMSEMLQDNVYGPLSPAQNDIAGRIVKNAHALERVFSELLDQSQIESGQLRLRQNVFSPQKLAEGVCDAYAAVAERKGLKLLREINPNLPTTIIADEERAKQVLSNLVTNGIKYSEEGTVIVRAYRVDNKHWGMQVADTGIGISPEAQNYIFEPFRQAGELVSREFGGVGLGLAIVKQLVTAMDGRIEVESEVGQGSVFTVILPFK